MILARDIMSENVVTIPQSTFLPQVAHLMLRDRVSAFPVVGEKQELVGIVTLTDLFKIIDVTGQQHGRDLKSHLAMFKNIRVAEIMSPDIITIAPDTTLTQIIRTLLERKMHTFPVLEQGKIVGIVSRHDILNAVFSYL